MIWLVIALIVVIGIIGASLIAVLSRIGDGLDRIYAALNDRAKTSSQKFND